MITEHDAAVKIAREQPWFVYLLECRGGRLYTGVTPDLRARIRKHRAGTGAKFTRGHPPERFLGATRCVSQGEALSMEHRVKQLRPAQKRTLAQTWNHHAAFEELVALFEGAALVTASSVMHANH